MPELTMTTLNHQRLANIAQQDVEGLIIAEESYGDSWKSRGGVGAFMMLARKWDRLETILQKAPHQYDILKEIVAEQAHGGEGCLDAVRDLRRYLLLVEAEAASLVKLPAQRDNLIADRRKEVAS